MSFFIDVIKSANSFLWAWIMPVLLLGTHLLYTLRLRFIQRDIFKAVKLSFCDAGSSSGTAATHFSALATTLAATLGTGNIIGISAAIASGGPGAVFWCWLTGIFGMATTYGECYLGIKYQTKRPDGSFTGGPMYVLRDRLGSRFLAVIYAAALLFASCGMGCATQSRAVTNALKTQFGLSPVLSGMILAVLIGLVIIGGIKSINKICTRLVPAMAVLYIGSCIILLLICHAYVLPAVKTILISAFYPNAIAGGLIGGTLKTAVRYGVSRGLFTNEAGIGTAALAASDVSSTPRRQALVSMSATFWDTVVICAVTGIVIVAALLKSPSSLLGYNENELTTVAFLSFGSAGPLLLTLSLCAFAAATLIGWSYFGEKAAEFLFGIKGIRIYRLIYIVMIFVSSVMSLDLIWELSDLANALMALPNLLCLLLLIREVHPK